MNAKLHKIISALDGRRVVKFDGSEDKAAETERFVSENVCEDGEKKTAGGRESRAEENRKRSWIIGIDGMAAAGKTTLAAEIAETFHGQVVHMDDFFLPAELRTEERLGEPGGNVHYERFSAEAASGLRRRALFEYGVFDCSRMTITGKRVIDGGGPVIVEGAYSLRPEFRDLYDLKIFMKINERLQTERVIVRGGEEKAEMFRERWIPLETAYFDALGAEEAADVVVEINGGLEEGFKEKIRVRKE